MQVTHMLDKNVISLLNDFNNKKVIKAETQRKMLDEMKKLDKKGNFISAIMSIMEGRQSKIETAIQKHDTIQKESKILKTYFKQASTDAEFFNNNILLCSTSFSGNIELTQSACEIYLNHFYRIWGNLHVNYTIPKNLREQFTIDLLNISRNEKISVGHPVIIVSILCIYGNESAVSVLKPNQAKVYNTYNDIAVLIRIGTLQAYNSNVKFMYHTLDKGLKSLLEIMVIDTKKYSQADNLYGGYSTSITYNIKSKHIPKNIINLLMQD